MTIENLIISWYQKNKRDLPWRKTRDPYKIWISEIILQQTRVDQGLSYYYNFLKNFPDVKTLANAKEEEVLKIWQGLGYYSRARNLHFSAKYIENELDGVFPASYPELKKLKGVGDYTAAAIASFAYNEKVPLVDGNVYRLFSRLYAESTPIDTTNGKKIFYAIASELLQNKEAEVFNQAIMEFGALQCKPKPNCTDCILNHKCQAFKMKVVDKFPIKSNKLTSKKRYFNYLIVETNESIYLHKRNGNDIWKGLYELPLIESASKISLANLCETPEWNGFFGEQKLLIDTNFDPILHKLTHQQLYVNFYHIMLKEKHQNLTLSGNFILVPINEIENYPVPKLIENHLLSTF
ncbi:MAG: A/G-specific adenine glycosylase [Bacteroidales bacterium]|nr:A/G-specific adenine glycosylase [Bacteroidales bacterium]